MLRNLIRAVSAIAVAPILALGSLGACSDDDGGCTFDCDTEYAARCDEQVVQTCRRSSQGCLNWVATTDCQQWGEFCHEDQGTAQCTEECVDLCTPSGAMRCQENDVQECQLAAGGCLAWVVTADCDVSGDTCQEDSGDATCVQDCAGTPPGMPSGPSPASGSTGVDHGTFASVDWDDASRASRYEVYFGPCPSPAWPAVSYIAVTTSERAGLTADENQQYCWRVVAFDSTDCRTVGPEWSFTTSCTDPVAGAPQVTSGSRSYAPLTSGTYRLTFNEPVQNVFASLTWTPGTGTGAMGMVTTVDASTYDVAFSGAAPGDSYTLTVGTGVTDHCGAAIAAPVDIQLTVDEQHGDTCADPQDITGASFPYGLVGTFDTDGTGSSCASAATNMVFYRYTPATSGAYTIDLTNATSTSAYSVLAIFEGTGCAPYGTEVACFDNDEKYISATVELTGGTSYIILFHTDGDAFTMVDPTITVTPLDLPPGGLCSTAVNVTGATFPVTLTGTFDFDPSSLGSCTTYGGNAVYYTYTPATSGDYYLFLSNSTTTNAYSTVTVYQTAACNPHGTEVFCQEANDLVVDGVVTLVGGTTYLIVFHTDDDQYTMVDPTIDIALFVSQPGDTCANAQDLQGQTLPFTRTGSYTRDGSGGTCDTTADNYVWFTYAPSTTGWYQVTGTNQATGTLSSRLAVFEGTACAPLGAELSCVPSTSGAASALVRLQAGMTYTIAFYTGSNAQPMLNPILDVQPGTPPPAGTYCDEPLSLDSVSFPHTVTGTFDRDGAGGTCDTVANNIMHYTYTPSASGLYRLSATNATTTNAYSRLALFQGTACSPYGTEVACVSTSTKTVTVEQDLQAGMTYLILFYTDGDSYTTVDPSVTITQITLQPGEACSSAVDLSSASFPHSLTGTFGYDAVGGSCDTTATNAVYYAYTPSSTGAYRIDTVNNTTTTAGTSIAVYAGAGCAPFGAQVACVTSTAKTGSAIVELTAGASYLIQVYTDGDTYTMVNPQITIAPHVFQPGEACSTAVDISSASFPHSLTGTFGYDFTGGSCDTTATNAVFYLYTPASTGAFRIDTVNATTTNAYTRIAVYQGAGCGPFGAQIACVTSAAKTGTAIVELTAGTPYLIQVYTDGDTYTMVDPQITIAPHVFQPGEACSTAVDLSSASFPHTQTGTFDYDFTGGTCDAEATNVVYFRYTAANTGSHQIQAVNATTTNAYSRLAVYQGLGCSPYGTQLACTSTSTLSASVSVTLSAGTTYLIQFYTDGDSYTMVNPRITITAP